MMGYCDTFISVSADTKAERGTDPRKEGCKPTVAAIQYALLADAPYTLTQEDVLFETHLRREGLSPDDAERQALRDVFFLIERPCMRASPLGKTYGWGIHYDSEGRMALFGMQTEAYRSFVARTDLRQLSAMAAKRR